MSVLRKSADLDFDHYGDFLGADPEQAWRMGIVSLILGVAIGLCMYSVIQKRRKE